jgi:hypothetical protein
MENAADKVALLQNLQNEKCSGQNNIYCRNYRMKNAADKVALLQNLTE